MLDKESSEITTFVDIKSAILRDNLREVCLDIRSVSLADSTPSVSGVFCVGSSNQPLLTISKRAVSEPFNPSISRD